MYLPLPTQQPQQPVLPTAQQAFGWQERLFDQQQYLSDTNPSEDYVLISPYVAGAFTHPELVNDYGYRREARIKPENTANPTTDDRLLINANLLPPPAMWTQ